MDTTGIFILTGNDIDDTLINKYSKKIFISKLLRYSESEYYGDIENKIFSTYDNSVILKVPKFHSASLLIYLKFLKERIQNNEGIIIKHHPEDTTSIFTDYKHYIEEIENNFLENHIYVANNIYVTFMDLFTTMRDEYNPNYSASITIDYKHAKPDHFLLCNSRVEKKVNDNLIIYNKDSVFKSPYKNDYILSNKLGKIPKHKIINYLKEV